MLLAGAQFQLVLRTGRVLLLTYSSAQVLHGVRISMARSAYAGAHEGESFTLGSEHARGGGGRLKDFLALRAEGSKYR